ncbi:MAG: NAD(P)-dependent oxidoreductase [Betaproteobacteria bacterium]|nr:NAD(P)-dependent oxidoreductase [Betaproteobacteria bacterium]
MLLTGGSGLLALNWACAIRDSHEVLLATHRRRADLAGTRSVELALEPLDTLTSALQRLAPDLVIHTAGLTSVDECERDPERSTHVNAALARNVALAAAAAGARLVHISTDHLFAGTRAFYTEAAQPEPLNAYARSKLLAEQWVAQVHPDALIVRTNFFGWGHAHRQSFSDWLYYGLDEGRELTLFDDAWFTPIHADTLAHACHALVDTGASGIYNVVGDERVSKYAFGAKLADTCGFSGALLLHGKIAAARLSAARPPDMSLDNSKARARLGTAFGSVADFLSLLQQQHRAGRREELRAAITG